MIAIGWFLDILKNKYIKFDGRAGRPEFWFFFLVAVVIGFALSIIESKMPWAGTTPIVAPIFYLATLLPCLAVSVRRLHDQDRSGWFVLLGLIPFVGSIILLIFMVLPGTPGDNRFGPPAPTSPSK